MKRKADFMLHKVGGNDILVPLGAQVLSRNGVIILNPTAACVWEMLSQERSLDELATAVAERFDVAPGTARNDVQTFVDEIMQLKLLEP